MSECKELLVVAEKLQSMVADTWGSGKEEAIQEIMLGQSLYGAHLKIEKLMENIKQAIAIEEADGDS